MDTKAIGGVVGPVSLKNILWNNPLRRKLQHSTDCNFWRDIESINCSKCFKMALYVIDSHCGPVKLGGTTRIVAFSLQ
jgi:hypothetical protein